MKTKIFAIGLKFISFNSIENFILSVDRFHLEVFIFEGDNVKSAWSTIQ
jgi:hypothetical protein